MITSYSARWLGCMLRAPLHITHVANHQMTLEVNQASAESMWAKHEEEFLFWNTPHHYQHIEAILEFAIEDCLMLTCKMTGHC